MHYLTDLIPPTETGDRLVLFLVLVAKSHHLELELGVLDTP